jgi:hypothetical protein
MITTALALSDWYELESELAGSERDKTSGLLSLKLPLKLKYWLNKLYDYVLKEKQDVSKLRDEMIKRLGTEDDTGNFTLQPIVDEEPNPNFTEFQEEIESLVKTVKEITHAEFKLSDFDNVEIDGNYRVFYKLLKE